MHYLDEVSRSPGALDPLHLPAQPPHALQQTRLVLDRVSHAGAASCDGHGVSGCCLSLPAILHFRHMGQTITIRLTKELAAWLEQVAKRSGMPRGRIIREQLEKARESGGEQAFMRLAGSVRGARDLSARKGFARS